MEREEIFDLIVSHAREVLPQLSEHTFQENDVLKDLGANSIDRSEIVMMTLDSLSLRISLMETIGANNIGELAGLLHEKL